MIKVVDMTAEVQDFNLDFEQDLERLYGKKTIPSGDKFNASRCPDVIYSNPINIWKDHKPNYLKTAEGKIAELQAIRSISINGQQKSVKYIPKIILVLESPHTKEFRAGKIAPAQGTSGLNIKKYLPSIFSAPQFNGYYVAIVNSIQYQCSLGRNLNLCENRKDKNELFNYLFNLHPMNACSYRDSLVKRVQSIYNPVTDIIVNCCTQGNHPYQGEKCIGECPKKDNSYLVYLAIKKIHRNVDICRVVRMQHPSRWYSSCASRCIWFYSQPFNMFLCEKDYSNLYPILFGNKKQTEGL